MATWSKNLIIFILLLTILFSGCNNENNNNNDNTPLPSPTEGYKNTVSLIDMSPLKIGFVTTESKISNLEKWQYLTDYLTARTGIPLEVKIFNNDTDLISSFSLDMDIAFIDGLAYVKAKKEVKIIPILRSIEDGSPFTISYIIVRKDSGLKSLSSLEERKFSFTDKGSAEGYLFPRIKLAEEGIKDINKYFSKINFTGDDLSSFLAVYNGYVDGGVVSKSTVQKEKERFQDILIIGETEPIPLKTIIVRKEMKAQYIQKLKKAFMEIGKTLDTRKLTKIINIDGFVESTDSDYEGIEEKLTVLEKLEKMN